MTQDSARRQIENRGGIGSFLFQSPLSVIKWYTTPVGATFTGLAMWRTGSMTLFPYSLPSFALRSQITKLSTKLGAPAWAANRAIPVLTGAGSFVGGAGSFSITNAVESVMGTGSTVFMGDFRKELTKTIRNKRWVKGGAGAVDDVLYGVANKMQSKYGKNAVAGVMTKLASDKKVLSTIHNSLMISRLGAILSPIAAGYMVGATVGRVASLAFKAGVSAIDYASARVEQIRSLEFGGTLGAGFRTQAAATERQRAVQMLQRTHLGGRRGLGTESQTYAALL